MESNISIIGSVTITEKDLDGNVLSVYTDNNVVTTLGKKSILRALTTKGSNLYTVESIVFGDDYGSGTVLAPEPPTENYLSTNQNVKYTLPIGNIAISYPTDTSTKLTGTIVGSTVMDLYPSLPNIIFTSATIRDEGGVSIASKRFPARTISSLSNMDIEWTLKIL